MAAEVGYGAVTQCDQRRWMKDEEGLLGQVGSSTGTGVLPVAERRKRGRERKRERYRETDRDKEMEILRG